MNKATMAGPLSRHLLLRRHNYMYRCSTKKEKLPAHKDRSNAAAQIKGIITQDSSHGKTRGQAHRPLPDDFVGPISQKKAERSHYAGNLETAPRD